MKNTNLELNSAKLIENESEKGAALIVALLVLVLLAGFVAVAISRTSAESQLVENGISESATYAAGQAALENSTRSFVDLFESKLSPSTAEINAVQNSVPAGFDNYAFQNSISQIGQSKSVILTGGSLNGLTSIRDSWEIKSTATQKYSGTTVSVHRQFYQDRVPIFQFGAFFEDDLELHNPGVFSFGGRVHTNRSFWITPGQVDVRFNSKVTAVEEIVNDSWLTKKASPDLGSYPVWFLDPTGTWQGLYPSTGSVDCTNPTANNVFAYDQYHPVCSPRSSWETDKLRFKGNLINHAAPLKLPLSKVGQALHQIIMRGKNVGDMAKIGNSVVAVTAATQDTDIGMRERFANKTGIRISLADAQNKLPGCASGTSPCGVRLDGPMGTSYGYQPLTMADGYQATALNGTRMAISSRQVWIKIETVSLNSTDLVPTTKDITQDILSLGVTERAPISANFKIFGYTTNADSRAVVKLQRYTLPGFSGTLPATANFLSSFAIDGVNQGIVTRYKDVLSNPVSGCVPAPPAVSCTPVNSYTPPFPNSKAGTGATSAAEDKAHLKWADINASGYKYAIVPFPIQLFDVREGEEKDDAPFLTATYTNTVPAAGVMSIVDIDMANLKKLLEGNFDNLFPANTPFALAAGHSLRSTDIPNNKGWVIYVSDRRGDADFDGEYDMEDIFQDGVLTFNEDSNGNGLLDVDFLNEAPNYSVAVPSGQAATADHSYFRRAVRVINGSRLPGSYDSVTPANTKGTTVATENGIYVKGNYNATGVSQVPTGVTPPESYFPHNTADDVPAAIASDATAMLSSAWQDGNSFINPFVTSNRKAVSTVFRFALISGRNRSGNDGVPFNPSGFRQFGGGIMNFWRLMEIWNGTSLNYSGSLISLFYSTNANAFFKCCSTTYGVPRRDWTFDTDFLDPNRLPPGTPFIYSLTLTGFERENDK